MNLNFKQQSNYVFPFIKHIEDEQQIGEKNESFNTWNETKAYSLQ